MAPNAPRWTRRRFLRVGAVGIGGGLVLAAVDRAIIESMASREAPRSPTPGASLEAGPEARLRFRSRPDLTPQPVAVLTVAGPVGDGHVFLSPQIDNGPSDGLVIVDNRGEPIWINPVSGRAAYNLQVQLYKGAPVLTWWEGTFDAGHGFGEGVVADMSYREIARVTAANDMQVDLHAFRISAQGTALITAYGQVPGVTTDGGQPILDNVVQELNIATGELLFEWRSYGAVGIEESYALPGAVLDYFHVNSVAVDLDGHLLVSARNTWAVYKLHRSSGAILWRMGGKRSDFSVAPDAEFAWQHDAQRQPDGTLTLFDDQAPPTPSRGLALRVDEAARTVALVREFKRPAQVSSDTRGNVQVLPNGNVFVGWGGAPYATEFGPLGDLRFDLALWPGELSYRAFRFPWRGRPSDPPAVAAELPSSGGTIVFASWNGATDVSQWQFLAGASKDGLSVATTVPRSGFETTARLQSRWAFVAVRAVDANGTALGTSATIRVGA